MFLTQLEVYARNQARLAGLESAPGVTELVAAPLYSSAGVVLLLIAPLLTMRLIAEERRSDTLTLLLSAPVTATEIVLGKFAGLMGFFVLMIVLLTLMPLSLSLGTSLDLGQLAACVLALLMLLSAFCALGLFISALTAHPMVAGISTFGALLLLWIIDWASATGSTDKTSALFGYLSLDHHYQPLLSGVFSSTDAGYFILFTAMFLALAVWRVDADRLQA
jgi:ABC-2 type transport system permease protein